MADAHEPARVFVPREHVNDDSVVILKVHRADGSFVEIDQLVLEVETSKTTVEIASPRAGTLRLCVKEQDEVQIGGLLFEVLGQSGPDTRIGGEAVSITGVDTSTAGESPAGVVFSYRARRRLEELGLSAARFADRRWVTVEDVETAAHLDAAVHRSPGGADVADGSAGTGLAELSAPPFEPAPAGSYTEHRRSKRKQAELASLMHYDTTSPQSCVAIDISVAGPRIVSPPPLFRHGISDLVVYEAGKLLPEYPELNAFHIDRKRYGVYDDVNFGISFDSGRNLKVLTLADADQMSLQQVQVGIEALLEQYETPRPMAPSLLQGSTVTLSDLSRSFVSYMLPLINGPQSLILGITRSRNGHSIYASFDHRIAEGLLVAGFLGDLGERIESYFGSQPADADVRCHACEKHVLEEVSLGGRGLLTVRLPGGEEALFCRNCFEGL